MPSFPPSLCQCGVGNLSRSHVEPWNGLHHAFLWISLIDWGLYIRCLHLIDSDHWHSFVFAHVTPLNEVSCIPSNHGAPLRPRWSFKGSYIDRLSALFYVTHPQTPFKNLGFVFLDTNDQWFFLYLVRSSLYYHVCLRGFAFKVVDRRFVHIQKNSHPSFRKSTQR